MSGLRYTFARYLRDRWVLGVIGVACLGGLGLMLKVMGLGTQAIALLLGFIVLCAVIVLAVVYGRQRRFWRQLEQAVARASRVSEVMALVNEPEFLEGSIAYDALEAAGSLAHGELWAERAITDDYRRYIELWIHETKTPIAAARLIARRLGGADGTAMANELERVEWQVEQALFFARSTAVNSDYEIREVNLAEACREACKRNVRFLTEHGCIPRFAMDQDLSVLSDRPWLLFMLGQVVVNAVQYGAQSLEFSAAVFDEGTPHGRTELTVADDGCGISEADLPRVFDRGFTGSNGRRRGNATGMGLYLVAVMGSRLGLGVALDSEEGRGTRVVFTFPHNRR